MSYSTHRAPRTFPCGSSFPPFPSSRDSRTHKARCRPKGLPLAYATLLLTLTGCGDSASHAKASTGETPSAPKEAPPAGSPTVDLGPGQEVDVSLPNKAGGFVDGLSIQKGGRVTATVSDSPSVYSGQLQEDGSRWALSLQEVGKVERITGGVAADGEGGVWVSDAVTSKFHHWSAQGKELASFDVPRFLGGFCVASKGTIIVSGLAPQLLREYDAATGSEVRRFGERREYESEDADAELNAGPVACGENRIYFAFRHPPFVLAFTGKGNILWEKPLPIETAPLKPEIKRSAVQEGMVTFQATYSLASLSITADDDGNLYVLQSGKNRVAAIASGSDRIAVFSPAGALIHQLKLPFQAHQIVAADGGLFAMGRHPLRLAKFDASELFHSNQ